MAWILIEQQGDMATAIPAAHVVEEGAEVRRALMQAAQQHHAPGSKIHCAEEHTLRIAAGEPDLGLCPARRPPRAQRRKEKQVSFVLRKDDAVLR